MLGYMYRFYSAGADFSKPSIIIHDSDEIHHIKDVLRLKKGQSIQIFNSRSQQAEVMLEAVSETSIKAQVVKIEESKQGGAKIILACAPPKKGKFEFIIEKCTELGVDEIIPLKTKRTEVIFEEDKWGVKSKRLEAVAVNAAKQSKRLKVPQIAPMMSLIHVLQKLDPQGVHVFPSLHQHPKHISEVLLKVGKDKPVTVFIGPEGDFTADEVELAIKYGCVPVTLGDTVLKVETAAIACVAAVKFLCRN
jgi:16S rRNA (uracil1498-N3)-methyltransferase